MCIIILGASGQIGNALYNRLKQEQIEVIGTSRKKLPNTSFIQFDPFADDWHILGTADVVINCIGIIKETSINNFARIHLQLTRQLLLHRKQIGDPKIIQLSALGASKDHAVSFLRTKGEADEMLLKKENTYVIRPSIVCTPNTMLLKKIKQLKNWAGYFNNQLLFPKGLLSSHVQPVLITDLAEIIIKLIDKNIPDRIIEVAGPEEISYHRLISISYSDHPSQFSYKEINESLVRAMAKYFIARFLPSLITYDQYQLLFYNNTSGSPVAERLLGRKLNRTDGFWEEHLKSKK